MPFSNGILKTILKITKSHNSFFPTIFPVTLNPIPAEAILINKHLIGMDAEV
jgi:hypothetical protein